MTDVVIRCENLSKQYRIGAKQEPYRTLRDSLANAAMAPFRMFTRNGNGSKGNGQETIWALKDVSFEVKRGEVVGIIGRNGAGKSTLLKILSRITEPTEGRAMLKGRIAALLEVGTGFNSELTGRENIYLNAAILGMKKAEIDRRFNEIVAFAEVEKFIDTPVKHYSSGMHLRLGFAVAAHLEPEILVVDEVLAVGDAQFQKKCLGKMGDVAKQGRTVLFVSHNMVAVQQLCQSGLVLHEGNVTFRGDTRSTIHNYIQQVTTVQAVALDQRQDRQGSQWLKFTKVAIYDSSGNELHQVISGQDVLIRLHYESGRQVRAASVFVSFNVRSSHGYLLANLNSVDSGYSRLDIHSSGYFECHWPQCNLRSGSYDCNLFCRVDGEIVDWMQNAFIINVEDADYYGTGKLVDRSGGDWLVDHSWASHQD